MTLLFEPTMPTQVQTLIKMVPCDLLFDPQIDVYVYLVRPPISPFFQCCSSVLT